MLMSFNVYAVETTGLFLNPFILMFIVIFPAETNIPANFNINTQDVVYYLLFSVLILIPHFAMDIILLNITELYHRWPLFDYIEFARFRFRTRTTRWKPNEPNLDETIQAHMQTLDQLCFSSQFYFLNSCYTTAILLTFFGITIMWNYSYNVFGDQLTPVYCLFMVFTGYVMQRVLYAVANRIKLWERSDHASNIAARQRLADKHLAKTSGSKHKVLPSGPVHLLDTATEKLVLRTGTGGITMNTEDGLVIDASDDMLMAANPDVFATVVHTLHKERQKKKKLGNKEKGKYLDDSSSTDSDEENRGWLRDADGSDERMREAFLLKNAPWILARLNVLLTPAAVERYRPYLMLQYRTLHNMVKHQRAAPQMYISSDSSLSSDDDGEKPMTLALRKRTAPKDGTTTYDEPSQHFVPVDITKPTKRMLMFWMVRARRLLHLRHLVRGVIQSELQHECYTCHRTHHLQVEQQYPMDDLLDDFDRAQQEHFPEFDAGFQQLRPNEQWRAYFRLHQRFRTRCRACISSDEYQMSELRRQHKLTLHITDEEESTSDDEDMMQGTSNTASQMGLTRAFAPIEVTEKTRAICKLWLSLAKQRLRRHGFQPNVIPTLPLGDIISLKSLGALHHQGQGSNQPSHLTTSTGQTTVEGVQKLQQKEPTAAQAAAAAAGHQTSVKSTATLAAPRVMTGTISAQDEFVPLNKPLRQDISDDESHTSDDDSIIASSRTASEEEAEHREKAPRAAAPAAAAAVATTSIPSKKATPRDATSTPAAATPKGPSFVVESESSRRAKQQQQPAFVVISQESGRKAAVTSATAATPEIPLVSPAPADAEVLKATPPDAATVTAASPAPGLEVVEPARIPEPEPTATISPIIVTEPAPSPTIEASPLSPSVMSEPEISISAPMPSPMAVAPTLVIDPVTPQASASLTSPAPIKSSPAPSKSPSKGVFAAYTASYLGKKASPAAASPLPMPAASPSMSQMSPLPPAAKVEQLPPVASIPPSQTPTSEEAAATSPTAADVDVPTAAPTTTGPTATPIEETPAADISTAASVAAAPTSTPTTSTARGTAGKSTPKTTGKVPAASKTTKAPASTTAKTTTTPAAAKSPGQSSLAKPPAASPGTKPAASPKGVFAAYTASYLGKKSPAATPVQMSATSAASASPLSPPLPPAAISAGGEKQPSPEPVAPTVESDAPISVTSLQPVVGKPVAAATAAPVSESTTAAATVSAVPVPIAPRHHGHASAHSFGGMAAPVRSTDHIPVMDTPAPAAAPVAPSTPAVVAPPAAINQPVVATPIPPSTTAAAAVSSPSPHDSTRVSAGRAPAATATTTAVTSGSAAPSTRRIAMRHDISSDEETATEHSDSEVEQQPGARKAIQDRIKAGRAAAAASAAPKNLGASDPISVSIFSPVSQPGVGPLPSPYPAQASPSIETINMASPQATPSITAPAGFSALRSPMSQEVMFSPTPAHHQQQRYPPFASPTPAGAPQAIPPPLHDISSDSEHDTDETDDERAPTAARPPPVAAGRAVGHNAWKTPKATASSSSSAPSAGASTTVASPSAVPVPIPANARAALLSPNTAAERRQRMQAVKQAAAAKNNNNISDDSDQD